MTFERRDLVTNLTPYRDMYLQALTNYCLSKAILENTLTEEEFILAEQKGYGWTIDLTNNFLTAKDKTHKYFLEHLELELQDAVELLRTTDEQGIVEGKYSWLGVDSVTKKVTINLPETILEVLEPQDSIPIRADKIKDKIKLIEGIEDILKP